MRAHVPPGKALAGSHASRGSGPVAPRWDAPTTPRPGTHDTFFRLPGILPDFIGQNRSRTYGAGLDPFAYERVTSGLDDLHDWPAAFVRAARDHLADGERYEGRGAVRSAGEAYRRAARWFHCAVLLPHPDREATAHAAAQADAAMGRALALLEPDAVRIEDASYAGWLRGAGSGRGGGGGGVVVVVPGLDSSKEEFHDVTEALLARGSAVFTMDGPGQGVRAATTTVTSEYEHVLTRLVDALHERLGPVPVGVVGLSLGGYYAALGAAREPRIRAAVTVSGPYRLTGWDDTVPFVRETLTQRAGSRDAARKFLAGVDLRGTAGRIAVPLLVVDGADDAIPGVENGERLAAEAPHGIYHSVPGGDHLLGNVREQWLPGAADWLAGQLTG
ncbi:alpha/beta fold hydrolase [Streptomyces kunmingensis]|uniref:Alpha/beta fold hydrolase n=1 Tax=Streptomyces kunmingensis TaxID=68225 RepID=A0ABU6CR95_9ACTN|nr:alpha/beta fold hydrolase [Streptomyces kunmingensis]MEB3966451.1 alpha/beta fold hydrolase [Streptomyces kunmingensis]